MEHEPQKKKNTRTHAHNCTMDAFSGNTAAYQLATLFVSTTISQKGVVTERHTVAKVNTFTGRYDKNRDPSQPVPFTSPLDGRR